MEIIRVMDGKYAEIELGDGKRVFISILNDRITASRMFCFIPFKKIWKFVFPFQIKTTFHSWDSSRSILKMILSEIDEVQSLEELQNCLENQVQRTLTKWVLSPNTLSLPVDKKEECKQKISLKDFSRQHFLPLVEKMVESEADLLQEDINKNNPPIPFNEEQTRFEIFLLFLHLSGRPLSQIQGLAKIDSQVGGTFALIIDEILSEKFAHIKLNPQWLDKDRTNVLNYYKNKNTAYHTPELLYHNSKISEEDLHRKISEVFFSLNADKINNSLITAIGDLHEGGFMYLFQKLSMFTEYEIALEKAGTEEIEETKTPEEQQDAVSQYNLGLTCFNLGRYQDAIEAYKQAIKIEPDNAEAYCCLGAAYSELDCHQEAIEACMQAIRFKPDYAEAHCRLGIAYGRLGRHQEAIEAYKQAIIIEPDQYLYYRLAAVYDKLGRHQESLEAYKQATRIEPDNASPHSQLGYVYQNLGRHQEAIEAYQQVIRIEPDNAGAHYGLGLAYSKTGDKGSVLEEYKILKTLDAELANELSKLIDK